MLSTKSIALTLTLVLTTVFGTAVQAQDIRTGSDSVGSKADVIRQTQEVGAWCVLLNRPC